MSTQAFVEELTAGISREYPELAGGLLANQITANDPLWEWASLAAEHVLNITGNDEGRIADCAEAFVVTSLDFLRLQARFMKTGHYAHSAASQSADLYSDAERMTEYLDGLALTYAMWPNHAKMLSFFATQFVPLIDAGGAVVEIGPGHGLFASVLLERRADIQYVGIDVSPHSIAYSAAAFAAADISEKRYELITADANVRDSALDRRFDAAICCEVLEHVDDPVALVLAVGARVASGAPTFFSTVANMEAEDHVFLFHDAQDIRSLLIENDFLVVEEQSLELPAAQTIAPKPLNYSAIARARSTDHRS